MTNHRRASLSGILIGHCNNPIILLVALSVWGTSACSGRAPSNSCSASSVAGEAGVDSCATGGANAAGTSAVAGSAAGGNTGGAGLSATGGASPSTGGASPGTGGYSATGGASGLCGDGHVDPGEACDDGDTIDGNGCDNNCTRTTCGNGVVDPGESCDLAITNSCSAVLSGSECNLSQTCIVAQTWDRSNCRARCESFVTTRVGATDHCCAPGGTSSNDVDCPQAYPFTKTLSLNPAAGSTSLDWGTGVTPTNAPYVPLAPASCGPVVMTVQISGNAFPSAKYPGNYAYSDLFVWYPINGNLAVDRIYVDNTDGADNPVLIQADQPNAVVTGNYHMSLCTACTSTSPSFLAGGTASISLAFSQFQPDVIVAAPTQPESPRITGDSQITMVAYRDVVSSQGSVELVGGHFSQTSGSYFLGTSNWVQGFAPIALSRPGYDAGPPAVVHGLDVLSTTPGQTYVVWVEAGTSLRLASVTNAGSVSSSQELRAGTGIRSAEVIALSPTSFGVGFIENVAGVDRIRVGLVNASGTLQGNWIDVTQGEGSVASPFFSPGRIAGDAAGVTWVDGRSGSPTLMFRSLDGTTLALSGSPVLYAPGSVNPSSPALAAMGGGFLAYWTDERDGQAQIYEAPVSATGTQTRLSFDGRPSFGPAIARVAAHTSASDLGFLPNDAQLVGWSQLGGSDQVRLARMNISSAGVALESSELSLACASAHTSSLDMFRTSYYRVNSHADSPQLLPVVQGVWIRDGQIVAKQLPDTLTRTPVRCTPGQLFCPNSRQLMLCGADGFSTSLAATCAWPEQCNASLGACSCIPGPACNGSVATVCNADGTYQAGGTDCATSGATCVEGACKAPLFADDFEDGNYDGWLKGSSQYTRTVTNATAAAGTNYSLMQQGTGDGLSRDAGGIRPTHISWWVRTNRVAAYTGMVEIWPTEGTPEQISFSSSGLTNFTSTVSAQANTWYHVEMRAINWTTHTYDFYVNDALVAANTKMYNQTASSVRSIALYNNGNATSYWDEVRME